MADWEPREFALRQAIFGVWRRVCLRYGYKEYLTPILENADIYRAKSGEDVGNKELMLFRDQGGRELAIRPEMTPSVTRMVSGFYRTAVKPLRLFSIANFVRNERPQRGRNREFWQLNCDIFGSDSLAADLEIAQLALDIMLEFKPPKNSFVLKINNRRLLESFLLDIVKIKKTEITALLRILDKFEKLNAKDFKAALGELGLDDGQIENVLLFIGAKKWNKISERFPLLENNSGLREIEELMENLFALGYKDLVEFSPGLIRGFDYYDGLVFEMFDKNSKNKRALFGGGRYNGLAEIFGKEKFPAVGIAPGDETLKLFLEGWGLLDGLIKKDQVYYLPLLAKELFLPVQKLAWRLRRQGKNVIVGFEQQKIKKALDFANKEKIDFLVILGEDELEKGVYKIKNMQSGEEIENDYGD